MCVSIYIYIYVYTRTHLLLVMYAYMYMSTSLPYCILQYPAGKVSKDEESEQPEKLAEAPRLQGRFSASTSIVESLNIIIPLKPYTDINRSCQLLDKISENPNDLEFPGSLPNTRTQWISRDINGESLDSVGMCHPCQGFRVAGFRGFVDL